LHSWRPLPLSNSLFPMFAGSGLDADVEPSASPSSPFEEEPPFEEQLLPPRKNVAEIAASTLPEHAKISAEVMWLLQQASCEFCSFVMSEAVSNIPDQTVRAGHILAAMRNLNWACFFPALEAVNTGLSEHERDLPPLAQMMQSQHSKHRVLGKKRKSRSESSTHALQALRTSASAASSSNGSTATFPPPAASSSCSTATVTVGKLDPEQDESFVRNGVDCPELADDAWTAMMTSLLFADSESEVL